MLLPTDSCPWEPKNPFSDHISGAGLEKQGQRQEALEIGTEPIIPSCPPLWVNFSCRKVPSLAGLMVGGLHVPG